MKRSAQVALVLMGVTGTTATAAYMMPPRPECRVAPAASTTVNPPHALAPAAASSSSSAAASSSSAAAAAASAAAEPCRRRSWSGWRWNSYSRSYSSYSSDGRYSNTRSYWSRRAPVAVSTALSSPGRSGASSTSSSSGSSTARGGFGATGHAVSGGGGGRSGGS